MNAVTVPAKYIFLDVVQFTQGRSVEAQANIVESMNLIVRKSLTEMMVPSEKTILIPTGDGICIALLNVEDPYDVHIQLALAILAELVGHNSKEDLKPRQFQIRIGINTNIDNLVTDINGSRNVAGAGINNASRVMSKADGNQILVSESVYETLRYREHYMSAFKAYTATVKHGITMPMYQLIGEFPGLNVSVPSSFASKPVQKPKFDKTTAHYFAFAIKYKQLLIQHDDLPASVIWLWHRAVDEEREEGRPDHVKPKYRTYGAPGSPPDLQLTYYCRVHFSLSWDLASYIWDEHLARFSEYFQNNALDLEYRFITSAGEQKLKTEWPDIYSQTMSAR